MNRISLISFIVAILCSAITVFGQERMNGLNSSEISMIFNGLYAEDKKDIITMQRIAESYTQSKMYKDYVKWIMPTETRLFMSDNEEKLNWEIVYAYGYCINKTICYEFIFQKAPGDEYADFLVVKRDTNQVLLEPLQYVDNYMNMLK